jgi:hypothetical protein
MLASGQASRQTDAMLSSYWRYLVTALGIAVGVLLLWALVADLSSVDQAYKHSAADASRHYRDDANRRIVETCGRLPATDQPRCVQGTEQAARENQREEQDLAAQNMTAWWTKIMGIAALVGMTLSAIGVWLILATFRENRKSADAAVRQVDLMRASQLPDLVVGNISYLRKTAPDAAEYISTPTSDGYVQVSFRNRNHTSLVYTEPSWYGWIVAPDLPDTPPNAHEVSFQRNRLDPAPGSEVSFSFDLPITKVQARALVKKRTHLWIWVRLEALDIYNGKHIVGMVAKWVPEGFKPSGDPEEMMWGNSFQAVFHSAYHYRKYEPKGREGT